MRFLFSAMALATAPVLVAIALIAFRDGKIAEAHQISGAIFTTLEDGTEVNQNIFEFKEDVYLDGGPGPAAPQGAAGLDDGTYVFQVTNPNGNVLLSTDAAKCRRFTVVDGVIDSVVATGGCEHNTGLDVDHGATTVQLVPFNLTPNPGGVFKVWVTRVEDFLLGCQELGKPGSTGLDLVDCGEAQDNAHGFIPAHSKTDNFKVRKARNGVEIDVRFFYDADNDGHYDWTQEEYLIPHMKAEWTDTVGASNVRFSNPKYIYGTFAHVEAAEPGTHVFEIIGGAACNIGLVHVNNVDQGYGPQAVNVLVTSKDSGTHFIDVACIPE